MHSLHALIFAVLALTGTSGFAQSVGLVGMMGAKALIVVDGSAPKGVGAGETFRGVKLISVQGDQAILEIAGKSHSMSVGDAPVSVGGSGAGSDGGSKIVLSAGSNGHFVTQGQINGKAVQLVVDTGASVVSLSASEAQRIGLNFQSAPMVAMSTANGVIPAWRMKLASVRVGDVVVYDLDAVVSSGSMPYVLLGNSFLSRFQMTRTNDQMVLDKRY
jgi:aspartyl protease family protein